ncbi:TetR family transcriptional regulator [Amycolatopsis sp. K13G38]|uniref:TetR family transcriptional regulator n=1 Tax=Amycolatopsis acididurans TaxID=2724524 RepID=A0ABX1IWR2_9PSEU|nr:TetR family transcriptional regulator [Amycolatopsis acididurans]NKQ51936.1 TetR family transcriptional regulator [Amycolatopsis acididurans]
MKGRELAAYKSAPVTAARLTAAERRARLAEAAARRFQDLGYHRVGLADVAADTGVTAPAVYRHFRNKQALLAGAIAHGMDQVEATLARTADESLEQMVAAIADLVLDRPYLWTLLQREARFLTADSHAEIQRQFDRVIDEFARRLRRRRPGLGLKDARLLVTAATSALAGPSLPRSAPRSLVAAELAGAAMAILLMPMPVAPMPAQSRAGRRRTTAPQDPADSRRDELLDAAIELFFRQGYSAVSIDDIGSSIGITGPSIYHHFPTKADILVAAFDQATERLAAEHDDRAGEQDHSLAGLIGTYADFCLRNRRLVGIYVSEAINLPPDSQRQVKNALRVRVTDWTDALTSEHPDVEQRTARIRAHIALTVIDDVARLGHLHTRPAISAEIRAVATAVLTGNRPASE